MSKISSVFDGGSGTIKYPYYKTGGSYQKKGLRNKRRAHWARERQIEMIEKERKAKAAEAAANRFDWDDNHQDY